MADTDKTPVDTKKAAVEGAQSVAEAVRRVADAAVAEVQKTDVPVASGDFVFSGAPGGKFVITGPGNLGSSGTVKIGQLQLHTLGWSTSRIDGNLPSNAPSGEVTVSLGDGVVRKGSFKR